MTHDDFWSRTNAVRWSDSKHLEEDPKTFWDGMNRSLEEAINDEIEDECLENNHAVRLSIVEDRAIPIVCGECKQKIETYQLDKFDIKTQAGLEMFKYFNDNYGSSIWGKVLEGIKAIEKELS